MKVDTLPKWKPEAVAMAKKVLQDNFVTEPPVRVDQIAERYGIKVFEVAFRPEHKDVSGFIDLENETVVVNKDDPIARQTFTLAHELGHFLLHKQELIEDPSRAIMFRQPLGAISDDLEKAANCFAAHLLVPENMLSEFEGADVNVLAKVFSVSSDVIGYRLADR